MSSLPILNNCSLAACLQYDPQGVWIDCSNIFTVTNIPSLWFRIRRSSLDSTLPDRSNEYWLKPRWGRWPRLIICVATLAPAFLFAMSFFFLSHCGVNSGDGPWPLLHQRAAVLEGRPSGVLLASHLNWLTHAHFRSRFYWNLQAPRDYFTAEVTKWLWPSKPKANKKVFLQARELWMDKLLKPAKKICSRGKCSPLPQFGWRSLSCFYCETDLMTVMGADKANDEQMFKCAHIRVYACVCLTPRCKITTWLTGEQVAVASMKMVFSWAPPLRAGKATHVIVMECVQSFILILGTPGGGVGWALWGKRGSLGSHWLPISQLGLSASRLGSHLSLHLSSFSPHKSHTLNCLFWIHKWCAELYWLCWYYMKPKSTFTAVYSGGRKSI